MKIYTNNEGTLEVDETIVPFEFLRGIENKDKAMGQAKNKKGETFAIYPAPCDTNNGGLSRSCYCWSTAKKVPVHANA